MLNVQLLLCLLLSVTGLCVADPELVYGKKGSLFTFICPYKKTSTETVVWELVYNAATLIPVSDGDFISNSPIKDRISLVGNHSAGEYNLELRQLQEYDELVYRCSVLAQQKEYKLEFIAPSSLLTLQDATDNKILGTEGQSLTMRCTATGGKPPPLVTMTVDNVPRSANQSVAYTLPLERRHDGLSVRCDANSSYLTSPLVAMATLYLQLKPLQPIFSPDLVSIEETKPFVVSCTSTGSRPAATFQWTIGMANVTSDSTTQSTVNTADNTFTVISTLRHNVDRTYNRQNITCTAVNVAANNGTSKLLDVKFAPDITVTNVIYNQNYANRTVTCNLDGNPTTYTYFKWQHKSLYGVLIRELDGGQNGVLTLTNIPVEDRYQDSGEYVCTANNGITGRDGRINQTGSAYITVNATQVLLKSRNHTEYGEFGKDVDVHVYVYSVPKYRSVRWYKTNTPISTTDKYALADTATIITDTFHGTVVQLDCYRITLTIKNLTESDFNVSYRVEMENNLGLLNYTIFLVSASSPQTPINFRALNSTQSSILVQWEAGYDGGQEQTFYVEHRKSGSSTWVAVKIQDSKQTGRQTYTLTGLQEATFYELRMYAENKFKRSLPTEPVTQETIQGSPQTPINFTILRSTETSIVVQWEAGFNGGHEQTFYLQFRRFGSSSWVAIKIPVTEKTGIQTFTVSELQDGILFELMMYAENMFNRSLPTETKTIATIKDSRISSTVDEKRGIAGGLSAVIFIMLIIIITLLILRKKGTNRQKSKGQYSRWNEETAYNIQMNCKESDGKTDLVEKDKNKTIIPSSNEYETLGMKDNPNTYSEILTLQGKKQSKTSAQEYETLGMADNPNTYSELKSQTGQQLCHTTTDFYESIGDQDELRVEQNNRA